MLAYLSLFWGLAFYLIAVALRGFPPLTVVWLRLLVGAGVLYMIMRWQGGRLPMEGAWWIRFVLLSLCGNLLPFSLISWGQTRITSGQAGLLMALMPISTVLLAHFYVAHEQLTSRRLLGIGLGFIGVAVLVGTEALREFGGAQLLGQLAVLAATLSYAVNSVYTKRLPPINTLVVSTAFTDRRYRGAVAPCAAGRPALDPATRRRCVVRCNRPGRIFYRAGNLGLFQGGIRLRSWLSLYHQLPDSRDCLHRGNTVFGGVCPGNPVCWFACYFVWHRAQPATQEKEVLTNKLTEIDRIGGGPAPLYRA